MTERDGNQRIALVTGGTSGIGLEIVRRLAGAGTPVHLCGRHEETVNGTVKELAGEGLPVTGSVCDVRDPQQIRELVRTVVEDHGPVRILVNNAGRNGGGVTAELDDELWTDVIETNLTSVFRVTKEVLTTGGMREAGHGRIVNIASTGGKQGVVLAAPYSASKHGVVGFQGARAGAGEDRHHGQRRLPRLRGDAHGTARARGLRGRLGRHGAGGLRPDHHPCADGPLRDRP